MLFMYRIGCYIKKCCAASHSIYVSWLLQSALLFFIMSETTDMNNVENAEPVSNEMPEEKNEEPKEVDEKTVLTVAEGRFWFACGRNDIF